MLNLKFGTDNVVRLPRSPWSVGCVSLENSLFLSLCAGSLMRVSAEDYGLLWGFCYLLSRLRCPSLVLFFPLSTPRGMLINDCYSAITEIGGKKEGHVTLNCTVGGGAYVFRFHMWVECTFIIHLQWKMSSATHKEAKIWRYIALVVENNL